MKLFFAPGACSLSPHIALREAGLDFELVQVDLRTKKTKTGEDFTTINPKGMVPTLQLDNGDTLTEGPAIVQYIGDQNLDSRIVPKPGTMERYHLMELLNFITSEMHKGYSPLFNSAVPEEYKVMARAALSKRYDHVDGILAGYPFLMGEHFTVADGYLFTVTNWARIVKFDLTPWKNVATFMDRIRARPHVQEALKAEGILK